MPIYEYRCPSCGFQKEHLQKMSDDPLSSCPSCGDAGYAKLLSAAGFQLKGSGWYATDFRGGQGATSFRPDGMAVGENAKIKVGFKYFSGTDDLMVNVL